MFNQIIATQRGGKKIKIGGKIQRRNTSRVGGEKNCSQKANETLSVRQLILALMSTQQEVMEGMTEDSHFISHPVTQS